MLKQQKLCRESRDFLDDNGHSILITDFLIGTIEEQIKYCFSIYDLNADGFIR